MDKKKEIKRHPLPNPQFDFYEDHLSIGEFAELYEELIDDLCDFAEKYEKLVWFGRSGCRLDNHPEELKQAVLDARATVEERYPDEVDSYHQNGDFQHGFNSGCLAVARYVLTATSPLVEVIESDNKDSKENEILRLGGIEIARGLFPELDT